MLNLRNNHHYKSKYRLFLLVLEKTKTYLIAQIKDIRNCRVYDGTSKGYTTEIELKISVGVDVAKLSNMANFFNWPVYARVFNLSKITTEAREYEAILNLKYSPLASLIFNPQSAETPFIFKSDALNKISKEIK